MYVEAQPGTSWLRWKLVRRTSDPASPDFNLFRIHNYRREQEPTCNWFSALSLASFDEQGCSSWVRFCPGGSPGDGSWELEDAGGGWTRIRTQVRLHVQQPARVTHVGEHQALCPRPSRAATAP